MNANDRVTGCLLGLACGDALGRPVEFMSSTSIANAHGQVTDMLARGTHGQPAGTLTDDTDLALCITRSLAERGAFDGADVARRFVEWYESDPFDVGLMTVDALQRIRNGTPWDEAGEEVWRERREGQNAGNGSLMRCAPYALAYRDDHARLADVSARSSAITHFDPRCREGCVALNRVLAELLAGSDPESALAAARDGAVERDAPEEIRTALATADDTAIATLETSGYVVHTLETALHDGLTAESAEEAVVTAVNRGGDTDTVGAVTGAIAGARFGESALPARWLNEISEADEIRALASEIDGVGT